jgi:uncharacterized membrane protein (DUF373 family)
MAATDSSLRLDKPPHHWMERAADLLLWVEHAAYVALGLLLCITALAALVGAAILLAQGLIDWGGTKTIFVIMDRLLFVLMLIEILHTVRASLSSGTLSCEPFLVVGLIASIRRVLVITLESSDFTKNDTGSPAADHLFRAAMIELGVLGMLILIMVVSIYILHQARKSDHATKAPDDSREPGRSKLQTKSSAALAGEEGAEPAHS